MRMRFQIGKPSESIVNMYGGAGIYSSSMSRSSICIGGTYYGTPSILTCGHGNLEDDIIYFGSSADPTKIIGEVAYQEISDLLDNPDQDFLASFGDYSIVTVSGDSNYTPTNGVYRESMYLTYITSYASPPVNTYVKKYGYAYGYATGQVMAVNITHWYDVDEDTSRGYCAKGLSRVDLGNTSGTRPVGKGDSGGSIYWVDGTSNAIGGLLTAADSSPISGTTKYRSYFTPIGYPYYAGFTPYTS